MVSKEFLTSIVSILLSFCLLNYRAYIICMQMSHTIVCLPFEQYKKTTLTVLKRINKNDEVILQKIKGGENPLLVRNLCKDPSTVG